MSSPPTNKSSGSRSTTASEEGAAAAASPAAAPLRVLVIDDDAERARLVEDGLAEDAVVHVAGHVHGPALLDLIARIGPDVIIIDCNSPDRDTIESLRTVVRHNPKPIVMFVEEEGSDRMRDAIEAGVGAYVIDGLTPKRVRPLIDVAITRFRVMDGMRSELEKTKEDLAARKVIERAKGLLMKQNNMSEDEAFRAMRDMSQQQAKPMKDVAENVIAILGLIARQ